MTGPIATTPEGSCPSCGRQIGPQRRRCIYCGAPRDGRRSIRSLNLAALPLLAAAGFWFHRAARFQPTTTPIAVLTESGNFRRFHVQGEVLAVRVRPDPYDRRCEIQIDLVDRSAAGKGFRAPPEHRIRLKAEGRIGRQLVDEERVPTVGQVVDATVSLFAGPGYRVLSLNSPAGLKVIGTGTPRRVEAGVSDLLDRPGDFEGKTVRISRAVVTRCRSRFAIEVSGSRSGKGLVVFGVDPWEFEPGDTVSVEGRFVPYTEKGTWEIKVPWERRGVRRLEPASGDRVSATVAELRGTPEAYENRPVLVPEARVTRLHRKYALEVADPAGGPSVQVFGIYPQAFSVGDRVAVRGLWIRYKAGGSWEIKAADGDGVAVHALDADPPRGKRPGRAQSGDGKGKGKGGPVRGKDGGDGQNRDRDEREQPSKGNGAGEPGGPGSRGKPEETR